MEVIHRCFAPCWCEGRAPGQVMRLGDVVTVGPRYVMNDYAPHQNPDGSGRGLFVHDNYAGESFRIVGFRKQYAILAPADLVGVDESDEVVDFRGSRLMLKGTV